MPVNKQVRDLVEAMAARETAKVRRMLEELPASDQKAYTDYLRAVFSVLVDEHFRDNLSRDAIASFVSRLRKEYRNTEQPFKGWVAEGVLRASCGETWIFDELSGEDIVSSQVLIVTSLAQQDGTTRPDLYRILAEADELLTEWEREG